MVLIIIILVISSALLWYDLARTQKELDRRSKVFGQAIAELNKQLSSRKK